MLLTDLLYSITILIAMSEITAVAKNDDFVDGGKVCEGSLSVFGRRWDVFPKVIVFDVDETLWPFWIDTHTTPPYRKIRTDSSNHGDPKTSRRRKRNKKKGSENTGTNEEIVVDGYGNRIELFEETELVLTTLRRVSGLRLAYASRTGEPEWMEELAKTIRFGNKMSMWDLPDYREIYPGSKIRHFRSISKKSGGVPCHEMLFFDDEPYSNMEVATKLGVTFVNAAGGVTEEMVIHGLEQYEKNYNARLHKSTEN